MSVSDDQNYRRGFHQAIATVEHLDRLGSLDHRPLDLQKLERMARAFRSSSKEHRHLADEIQQAHEKWSKKRRMRWYDAARSSDDGVCGNDTNYANEKIERAYRRGFDQAFAIVQYLLTGEGFGGFEAKDSPMAIDANRAKRISFRMRTELKSHRYFGHEFIARYVGKAKQ